MRRLRVLFLLLASGPLYSQNTISVVAVSSMHVCSDQESASGRPCATAPRPLSRVNPSYPERARQERKEGTVALGLTVGKDGSVSGVHVVQGVAKDIDQAAIEAVSRRRFAPGTYQGDAVDVELTVTVNFRLSTNPQQALLSGNPQEQKETADDFRNTYADAVEAYNRGDYATAANLLRKATSMNPENGS